MGWVRGKLASVLYVQCEQRLFMEMTRCDARKEQQQRMRCGLVLGMDELIHKIGVNQRLNCSETHTLMFLVR